MLANNTEGGNTGFLMGLEGYIIYKFHGEQKHKHNSLVLNTAI